MSEWIVFNSMKQRNVTNKPRDYMAAVTSEWRLVWIVPTYPSTSAFFTSLKGKERIIAIIPI